jgi:LysR family cys regulon transcriptional activator
MNLQQLRYLCTVAGHDFNVSKAARALHTSQPGVSKQIRLLEQELGVDLLVRRGNRIVAVTEPGKSALDIAERMMQGAANLKTLGREFTAGDSGELTVAATSVHSRYWLLPAVVQFSKRYPDVHLKLLRGTPTQVLGMVESGEAQIGICTPPHRAINDLLLLPCHEIQRAVITPARHPLLRKRRITLEDLARHPLIIQTAESSGGWTVLQAFEARGLRPKVVMDIVDAEMAKACVEQNIGITVLPARVFDKKRDKNLRALDAGHLFAPLVIHAVIHKNTYLRDYAHDFIQSFAPRWNRLAVQKAARHR